MSHEKVGPVPVHRQMIYRALLRVRPAPVAALLKRLLRVRRVPIETKYGVFLIDPVSGFGRTLEADLVYEPGMIEHMERYLRPGSTFVDIGANDREAMSTHELVADYVIGQTPRLSAAAAQ